MATPKSAAKKGRKSQTPKPPKAAKAESVKKQEKKLESEKKEGEEAVEEKPKEAAEEEKAPDKEMAGEEEGDEEMKDDDDDEENAKEEEEKEEEEGGDGKKKRQRKRKRKGDNKAADGDGDDDKDAEADGDDKEESKKSPKKKNKGENSHTVYVEGLPYTSSEAEVKKFFKENGGIADIVDVRLSRWRDTGRLRGFGHVQFESLESHKKALACQGKKVGGRYLNIRNAEAPRKDVVSAGGQKPREQPPGCRTVFVRNLPYSTNDAEIGKVLSEFGKIVPQGVRMVYAAQGGQRRFKGFAYVEFKNPEGAHDAVQQGATPDGISVGGRRCQLDYDEQGKAKESYRTEDGKLYNKEQRKAEVKQ